MQIISDKFGVVKIDDNSIIDFPGGIPGFTNLTKFAIVKCLQTDPVQWFQSVEDGHVTLPVINPFLIKPDYNIEINDDDLDLIRTHNEEDLIVLNVMVLPEDLKNMTVNLMAPILVNIKDMIGCQILMDHKDVPLRYPAYRALIEYYGNNDAEGWTTVLVLTRKIDEAILIGDDIKITLLHVESDRVRLGIEAPRHMRIFRFETMKKIMLENQLAAGENVNLVALSHLKEEASKND